MQEAGGRNLRISHSQEVVPWLVLTNIAISYAVIQRTLEEWTFSQQEFNTRTSNRQKSNISHWFILAHHFPSVGKIPMQEAGGRNSSFLSQEVVPCQWHLRKQEEWRCSSTGVTWILWKLRHDKIGYLVSNSNISYQWNKEVSRSSSEDPRRFSSMGTHSSHCWCGGKVENHDMYGILHFKSHVCVASGLSLFYLFISQYIDRNRKQESRMNLHQVFVLLLYCRYWLDESMSNRWGTAGVSVHTLHQFALQFAKFLSRWFDIFEITIQKHFHPIVIAAPILSNFSPLDSVLI